MRSLNVIAREIHREWKRPFFGAVPYINAMYSLHDMGDMYGAQSADDIVCYFLANAATWRGDAARRIKAELKAMID